MSTDITPVGTDHSMPAPDGAPFVRVLIDKANGHAIVALDARAVAALLSYIDDLGPGYDLVQNPGSYGVDADRADYLSDVTGRITTPLAKLLGYL